MVKDHLLTVTQDNECGDGLTCMDLTPTQLKDTYPAIKKWCCSSSGSISSVYQYLKDLIQYTPRA